jgi:uncharacterized membrane protein
MFEILLSLMAIPSHIFLNFGRGYAIRTETTMAGRTCMLRLWESQSQSWFIGDTIKCIELQA